MEVVNNSFLPGDPRLIDNIVYQLKSQGIFDNFRKECIADVDTKPAYQNLKQRVEGSVSGFLKTQKWRSDMNKNHVREMLRKNISESGFLETGVERIVDQVVNPKINTIFLPQVENVVYKVLGIQKPTAFDDLKKEDKVEDVKLDLLPNDLEAVSPESEPQEKKMDTSNESQKLDEKIEEDESPPFEPLEPNLQNEENSVDSNLSGISGLISHDSNHSAENVKKELPLEISNPDSQLSKQSSDDRLSIVMSDEQDIKVEANDDSNTSKVSSIKIVDTNSKSVDVPDSQSSSEMTELTSSTTAVTTEKPEEIKKVDEKRSSEKKSDKHHSSHKHSSHKSKYDSKDRRSDKDKKSDKDRKDHRNHKSSESSEKKDKDKKSKSEKDDKHGDSKGSKDSKSERNRERTSSGHRHSKDKSSKRDSHDNKKESSDNKESSKSKTTSESKDSKTKESKDRSKDESKSRSHSSSKKSKDDGKSHSKHNGKSKSESSDSNKTSSKDSKRSEKSHKKDDKHSSSHSSDKKNDKRDKDKKDSRREYKKENKDDHYSLKEKKSHRRSTDRDSSDGHSGTHSSSSSFTDLNSSQLLKSSQETSVVDSGATSGGDSGNSDAIISLLSQTTDISSIPCIVSEEENARVLSNKIPHLKLIKPKFASNIFEARKLMKIRKRLSKLEKQKQMELMRTNNVITESSLSGNNSNSHNISHKAILDTVTVGTIPPKNKKNNTNSISNKAKKDKDFKKVVNEVEVVQPPIEEEPLQTSVISKESWDAIEAKLNAQNIIDYNSYTDSSENIHKIQMVKKAEETISKKQENVEEVEEKVNIDHHFKGFNNVLVANAEKCLKLSYQVISNWESDLAKLSKAYLLSLADKDKLRLEKNNEEFNELNRLPKIEILDVTSNNEVIFSPGRGIKRIANDHTDVHNNNKINKELGDLLSDRLNDITDSQEQSAIPMHKSKKQKLTDTSVNSLENFNLPLSPADSEKSYNSINEKKSEIPEGRPRRNRAASTQRYSSDDLYKPRLQFTSTRRRTTNTEKN